jgi:hypothetical protein
MMSAFRQKRLWFWVAIAAITIAFIVLLVPHTGDSTDQVAWLGLLPILFIGLLLPLNLLRLRGELRIEFAPGAPALAPSFQRPPPSHLS